MPSLAFDFIGRRDTVSPMLKHIGDETDRTERKMRGFHAGIGAVATQGGAKLKSFAGFAATGLAGVGVALGTAAVAAAGMGIKTASGLQQAQIAFETLMHSSSKAHDFLAQLQTFAAATPFELPGLIDDARLLMGVGISAKQIIPDLTNLGDAAGALGIQQEGFQRIMLAVSQSFSAGRVNAGDMNQIVEAGIPIWTIMSQALGKPVASIRKLSEQGKLLSADVLPKVFDQMHKDYGGAMGKQSQMLNGLWSTFMDTLHIGLANAVMPLVPVLQQMLPGAMRILGGALKGLAVGVKATVNFLSPLRGVFHNVADAIGRFFASLKSSGALDAARARFAAFGGWLTGTLLPVLRHIARDALGGLRDAWNSISASLKRNRPQFEALAKALGDIATVIVKDVAPALGPVLGFAFRQMGRNISAVIDAMGILTDAFIALAPSVLRAMKLMEEGSLDALGTILHAQAIAFGWIPGLGGKLRSADKAFRNFRSGVLKSFDDMIAKSDDWQRSRAEASKELKLRANITDLDKKIASAKTELKTVPPQHRSDIIATITDLVRKKNQAVAELARLHDKHVNVSASFSPQKSPLKIYSPSAAGAVFSVVMRKVGGWIPGSGRGDKVPALLEPDEFVVRRDVATRNRGFLEWFNANGAEMGKHGDAGMPARFARGGFVSRHGEHLAHLQHLAHLEHMAHLRNLQMFPHLPNVVRWGAVSEGLWNRLLASGWRGRAGDGMEALYRPARFAGGGSVPAVQAWLRQQNGNPYVWGATGPTIYDCSGLVGEVINRLEGWPSYHRLFTTSDEASRPYLSPGSGILTVGVGHGHTVGNLAGLGFEAANPRAGIRVGGSATPPSALGTVLHLKDLAWFTPEQMRAITREAAARVKYNLSGFRAAGGPVRAGYAYRVGEHGEETFVPGSDGYVHARPLRGARLDSGPAINITVYGVVGNPQQVAKEIHAQLLKLRRDRGAGLALG